MDQQAAIIAAHSTVTARRLRATRTRLLQARMAMAS